MSERFRSAKCCISERPLANCKGVNVVETDFIATWHNPYLTDLDKENDYHHALAFIHDDYAPADYDFSKIPAVKFVIEYRGDEIIYHPVEDLERGPRPDVINT